MIIIIIIIIIITRTENAGLKNAGPLSRLSLFSNSSFCALVFLTIPLFQYKLIHFFSSPSVIHDYFDTFALLMLLHITRAYLIVHCLHVCCFAANKAVMYVRNVIAKTGV